MWKAPLHLLRERRRRYQAAQWLRQVMQRQDPAILYAAPADLLNTSIDLLEQILRSTADDNPLCPAVKAWLSIFLYVRYRRIGDEVDLDRAISLDEQAVAAVPADDPQRVTYICDLVNALVTRMERTRKYPDLDRIVDLGEQAMVAVPADGPQQPVCLATLGSALHMRYERTGEQADLVRAVDVSEQAVAAFQADDPQRAGYLANLAKALGSLYECTGKPADLDRAIEVDQQAIAAVADIPFRAILLSNLCDHLRVRYELTGEQTDLIGAVDVGEQAVAAAAADDPYRAMYLCNLAVALGSLYERTSDRAALDRAIDVGEQALAAAPADDPHRAMFLSDLDHNLSNRYERTGAQADLDRAIDVGEQAVAAAPADDPHRAMFLNNFGNDLRTRYEHTSQLADLDRAVDVGEQALACAPAGDPGRAMYAHSLGATLYSRYERVRKQADLLRAVQVFREGAWEASAPPLRRARAARQWGTCAGEAGDRMQAVEAFTLAVRLLGEVAPRGLSRSDQEGRLGIMTGLGSQAAAACLAAGLTDRAVELFEQGRGVLFAQALDSRTDLTDLARKHPDLAGRFTHLVSEADQPAAARARTASSLASGAEPVMRGLAAADSHRQAAAQLRQVLEEIRGQPGFERFMLARPVGELLSATANGPVVLVNVAELRSDALILRPAGVEVVELAEVNPRAVINQVDAFLSALSDAQAPGTEPRHRKAAEAQLAEVLDWLWDSVTAPILDRLGFTRAPSEDQPWPHVYWCPSGPLAFLPLHAAGHHDTAHGPPPATVVDRVISSAIPTVRALLQARGAVTEPLKTEGSGRARDRVLVAAMPITPGQRDLPGAVKEAAVLLGLFPDRVDILGLPGRPPATYNTVTAALPSHAWAHFSCHGASNPHDPSSSQLLLQDHQSRPLTVLDLSHARLTGVDLAFLSACNTARGGTDLPDEPIHLAAACQLAGYRHVIATLWPIDDTDAVTVTRSVYTSLVADGASPRADTAAAAVHHATRRLRALYPDRPSRWAAYTHTGP